MIPRALVALLLAACSDAHVPNLAEPTCGRVATHAVQAGPGQCILLTAPTDYVVFQRSEETGCDGAQCLRLEPGDTAYALARAFEREPDGAWDVWTGECPTVPDCE